jgi:hypothetical protein
VRPGVNVTTRENAPPSTIPTDVGTGFMVGITEAGPLTPSGRDLVQNMDEYTAKYAPTGRTYTQGITMHDSAETFFNEGGNRLYVGRVVGPAAATAVKALNDSGAAIALNVAANGPGEWGNDIQVVVNTTTQDPNISAGNFRLIVKRVSTGEVFDSSPDLLDNTAAVAWSSGSSIIKITAGVSLLDPVAGSFTLAGGANDAAAITNTQWETAINNVSAALGPGILTVPGATTTAIQVAAAKHAQTRGRVVFLDGPDTATAATLVAAVKTIVDNSLKRSRYAGMFAPWLNVAGLAPGTVRKVPPSPVVAGAFARNMANGLSANEPAAGENGKVRSALGLTQLYSDTDRQTLNDNGINVVRDVYGVVKVYGWRSTADPAVDISWVNLGNSIMHRQIVAEAGAVGERFVFKQIDGQGRLASQFGGALVGEVCMPMFLNGSLFGEDPDDAFKVDTGPSVNTEATAANNELRAVIAVKMSPFGEEVNIEIVKYLVTETIPA